MDVVTSQRWMLGSLNFICGCFYITPLKPLFLPGIPWSLLLDINGTFLHHTRGWTFLLDTMVVVTGLCCTVIRYSRYILFCQEKDYFYIYLRKLCKEFYVNSKWAYNRNAIFCFL